MPGCIGSASHYSLTARSLHTMQFETGTVKPVPNLVNDISFLIFNKCQEGFLVFSPVWIPCRDLYCIFCHHRPTHNRHRSGEGGRALFVRKLRHSARSSTEGIVQTYQAPDSPHGPFCKLLLLQKYTGAHTSALWPIPRRGTRRACLIATNSGVSADALPTCESFSTWALSEICDNLMLLMFTCTNRATIFTRHGGAAVSRHSAATVPTAWWSLHEPSSWAAWLPSRAPGGTMPHAQAMTRLRPATLDRHRLLARTRRSLNGPAYFFF